MDQALTIALIIALGLGWLAELLRRHAAERKLELAHMRSEAARTARAVAYGEAHEAATLRYRRAVHAWMATVPQAFVARDVPERYEVASAAQAIDRLEAARAAEYAAEQHELRGRDGLR